MALTIVKELNPVKIALSSRIAFLIIQVLFIKIGSKYDTSSVHQSYLSRSIKSFSSDNRAEFHNYLNQTRMDHFLLNNLNGLGNWDSIYFLHIGEFGYEYEQFMAFFPLYPICLSAVANIIHLVSYTALSKLASFYFASLLLNILAFTTAALFLHKLTRKILKNSKFADVSVLLFCINPANVFNMAAYTESLYVCLQFMGMHTLESNNSTWSYLKAGLLFALGAATRSNGILSAGFLVCLFLHEFLYMSITEAKDNHTWKIRPNINFTRLIQLLWASFVGIIMIIAAFLLFQMYGYSIYCTDSSKTLTAYKDHWCHKFIPLSYNYIQSHYWNVGPFRYYEAKQIPNFVLALPAVFMSYSAVWSYFADNGLIKSFIGYLIGGENAEKRQDVNASTVKDCYQSQGILPYVCHLFFLVTFGLVNVHVQVLTRMVFSATPLLYWFAAKILLNSNVQKYSAFSKTGMVLGFFIFYSLIGLLLHCNFYPWT